MKNPQAMLTHGNREKRRFIPWENLSAWVFQEENSNLNLGLSLDWVFYRWLEVLDRKQEKSEWSYGFYPRVWQRDIWWFGHLWCHFVGPCNLTKSKTGYRKLLLQMQLCKIKTEKKHMEIKTGSTMFLPCIVLHTPLKLNIKVCLIVTYPVIDKCVFCHILIFLS